MLFPPFMLTYFADTLFVRATCRQSRYAIPQVPGRVFGKGGMISCIYLTCKAAMGGIAAPSGTEQEEWLAAVRKDQPAEVKRSMQFSQGVVLGHALVCAASILTGQWVFILIVNL